MEIKDKFRIKMIKQISPYFDKDSMEYISSHMEWMELSDLHALIYRCLRKRKIYGEMHGKVIYDSTGGFYYFSLIFPYGSQQQWEKLRDDLYAHSGSLVGKIAVTCIQRLVE